MKSLHRTVDPRVSLSLGRGISVHIPKESTGSAGLRGMKFQAWLTGVGWTLNPDSQHRKLSMDQFIALTPAWIYQIK